MLIFRFQLIWCFGAVLTINIIFFLPVLSLFSDYKTSVLITILINIICIQ